ncbi:MAG: low molecular weight phosphotyrosine protein phosphatase [Clostridia bacterium]|nr:low molecular weight phosphotyrosine protein phosphatase [Clostridia bacterium]MBQ9921798.1 low molecular weight phosphotyrosine protein phosphatase [Clostridia bacterium]
MTKILFVCHGNICRSPMAEFVFKDIIKKAGLDDRFCVASAATSYEEIGNPVHPGTARILDRLGISYRGKRAVHLEKTDYAKYDFLICMDSANVRNTLRITGGDPDNKVRKLLEFAHSDRDVADPWYTGNFEKTYDDVLTGCTGLLEYIRGNTAKPYL